MKETLSYIRKDKRYKRFIRSVMQGKFSIDSEGLIAEIRDMHELRLTRFLNTNDVITKFRTKYLDASLQNTAFRSRAVAIRMSCYERIIYMDKTLPAMKKYIKSRYSEVLKSEFSTQAERDAYIDTLLQKAFQKRSQLDGVIKYSDIFISDIDAAGWTLKGIVDAMNIAHEKRVAKL